MDYSFINNISTEIKSFLFHDVGPEWTSGTNPSVSKSHTVHFVLSGHAKCCYHDCSLNLTPGTLWFAPGGLQIERFCEQRYHHLGITLSVHGLGSRDLLKESPTPFILDQINLKSPLYKTIFENLLQNEMTPASLIFVKGRIHAGIVQSKSFARKLEEQSLGYHLFTPAFKYLQENLSNTCQVDDLAKTLNMHRTAFSRSFKKQLGISPKEFIHTELNSLALEYVRTTQLSFKEIAIKLGFNDAFYFSRFFKRHNGMSPKYLRDTL